MARLGRSGRDDTVRRDPIAVCDVGGGSTQVTVGDRRDGVCWSRSFAVGSLRLTAALLDRDPPTPEQFRAAAAYVEERLADLDAPAVGSVLAVGGSARAVSRLVGRRLDEKALERALELIGSRSVERLTRELPVDAARAATLAGGATILLGVATRLGRPLEPAGPACGKERSPACSLVARPPERSV